MLSNTTLVESAHFRRCEEKSKACLVEKYNLYLEIRNIELYFDATMSKYNLNVACFRDK